MSPLLRNGDLASCPEEVFSGHCSLPCARSALVSAVAFLWPQMCTVIKLSYRVGPVFYLH